jgi:TrmH family RNA methyltransferase
MRREITGFSNPLLKEVRSLREKKHRKRSGRFLAEGLRIMTEARDAGHLPEMLFRVAGREVHPLELLLEVDVLASGGDVIETSADIMAKLSGKENAQAVVGVYREFGKAIGELDRNSAPIWLVAQAMRDPGNLGTMLRTGDAVGAGGLILIDDCTDPFSVESVRASMGAIFTQAVVQCRWEEFTEWLRSGSCNGNRGQLVGTSLQTDTDYRACGYTAPCFILTGNEAQGLPERYEAECDALVKMPMYGRADSLNAAVATAVMAYEVRGQLQNSE